MSGVEMIRPGRVPMTHGEPGPGPKNGGRVSLSASAQRNGEVTLLLRTETRWLCSCSARVKGSIRACGDGRSAGQLEPPALVQNEPSCYHFRVLDPRLPL